jgi:hypothetical protein
MEEIKIKKFNGEKRSSAKKGQCKYPFASMEVDIAFEVPDGKQFSVSTLAKRYGDSCDPIRTFSVKKYSDMKYWCRRLS